MMDKRNSYRYAFGPVPSRRLGRSLGLDLVPFKTCTYDCIYCQLGRTTRKTTERKVYAPVSEILAEVESRLKAETPPDYITLSGSGEPTLHSDISGIIAGLKKITRIPIAVLTNGSLLASKAVREALMNADLVIPSLDAGDDVLSRIRHSTSCSDCLEDMREVLTHDLAAMIENLCRDASVNRQQIYEVALAGNTTMQQILCGINSRFLGEVPFVPAHARGILLAARRLGLPIAHCGMAYVFPIIGGFVGGDTAAGMLSTKILEREAPVLLVDIGTNGEIVLAHNGRLWAASTAAGPAFEGSRITCGMRAARGAIEKIVLDGDVHLGTIGNAPPGGICGSGLIDLVAELLNHGIITPEGQLLLPNELPANLSKALGRRVRLTDDGTTEFLVAGRSRGQTEEPIVLTQRDIREVQLGAGAIRAGTSILLKKAGVCAGDIRSVLLAGGFGNFIRRNHAQRIGLLPAGIAKSSTMWERFKFET